MDFSLSACRHACGSLLLSKLKLHSEFWKDESLVWACLKAEHDIESIFSHVRNFVWRDKEFVLGTMNEKWFHPLTSVEFQDQEFDYFDYIHESLKLDKDIISAVNKLKNIEGS